MNFVFYGHDLVVILKKKPLLRYDCYSLLVSTTSRVHGTRLRLAGCLRVGSVEVLAVVNEGRRSRRRQRCVLVQVDLRRDHRLQVGRCGRSFQRRLHGQVPEARMLLEVAFRFELVAQRARKVLQVLTGRRLHGRRAKQRRTNRVNSDFPAVGTTTYRRAILLHWMRQFVVFGDAAGEEASLAHVETHTFQTPVPIFGGSKRNAGSSNWIMA